MRRLGLTKGSFFLKPRGLALVNHKETTITNNGSHSHNQRRAAVDIPQNLSLWCSKGGADTVLESPGSGIPHLFVVWQNGNTIKR